MMHLFAILIVATAHAADRGYTFPANWLTEENLAGWPSGLIFIGGLCTIVLWQWLVTLWCEWRMKRRQRVAALHMADLVRTLAQILIVATYIVCTLWLDWFETVRLIIGRDMLFIDVLLTLLPALVALGLTWAVHYPIVKRIRDATTIRSLDDGKPMYVMPGRWAFTFMQIRVQLLFLIVPLMLIVTWSEAVEMIWPTDRGPGGTFDSMRDLWNQLLSFGGALTVFIIAPLIARFVLDLEPMPKGDLRERLLQLCKDHKVRVRGVMLWKTSGAMINGAVMGLVGRLRYIMLTDALLESMHARQVEAVMAHEIAHVKKHHMPWMIAALFASILVPSVIFELGLRWWNAANDLPRYSPPSGWVEGGALAAIGIVAFFTFGWVSRRFERQADTFAAEHLSDIENRDNETEENLTGAKAQPGDHITSQGSWIMRDALASVCHLNGIDPAKRSWRHGSIRWRQDYLKSIVGQARNQLSIHRHVRLVKIATAAALFATLPFLVHDVIEAAEHSNDTRIDQTQQEIFDAFFPPNFSVDENFQTMD